jgi:type I restriction enzyme R subunit
MAKNRHYIDEVTFVEDPFLDQMREMLGWETERLKFPSEGVQYPEDSGRESFTEVILKPRLVKALKQINPWLEDDQIPALVRKISTFSSQSLLEMNQELLGRLLEGTTVSENRKTGRANPTVRYVDFENRENNDFYAVAQLKVRIPGTEHHIYPDIVCFLNGLPIAVVECKSPKVNDSINEAITQLLRYSEQRESSVPEGNKMLFAYNQFVIATDRNTAKFGTISTHTENYFYRWTDPYPHELDDIRTGSSSPNDQQRLVAGMFTKQNLLELIRCFTIFKTTDEGKTIKLVGRYQQFRAVKKIIYGLENGKNPDERGGIIWHTQGSGKSLTMMFLVRMMKVNDNLKSWKVVFITDRTDLERQLGDTSAVIGYSTNVVKRSSDLPQALGSDSADLVMVMIHKFQGDVMINYGILPEMNTSSNILVMTDEAHRTQYSILAANLQKAVPNATHIGFTGTPIPKMERRFKKYIDEYSMKRAVEDGVTLEIVYEGRTNNGLVKDQKAMNEKFIDVFIDYPDDQREKILGHATRLAYLEAKETIRDKAEDMIDHYVEHIFTNGFKAQVVAPSRIGCIRYKKALEKALQEKIQKLEQANPFSVDLELLKRLKIDVIMSGGNNDDPKLKEFVYADSVKNGLIEDFKKSFPKDDSDGGLTGIVIVTSMLLTGFDAPIEQVMYLDRRIVAHNLLQAIARVNRVGKSHKHAGFIIDYIGIGHHLKDAILEYSKQKGEIAVDDEEVDEILGCLQSKTQELNDLQYARDEVFAMLEKYGIHDTYDYDAFFDVFYDEDLRFEYTQKFKSFAKAFDTLLPDPDALQFLKDYH